MRIVRKAKHASTRSGSLSLHVVPVLVWLAVLGCVSFLFVHRAERCELVGLVFGETFEVAATCDGRVKSLPIRLYDRVEKNDVLAMVNTVVDNENLRAELETQKATIETEIMGIKAQLVAAEEEFKIQLADRQDDTAAAYRRLCVDVERTRIAVLELEAILEPDRLMLKDLELEVRIVKNLLAKNAIEAYELQKVELEKDMLVKKIETNEQLQTQARTDAGQSLKRLNEFISKDPVVPSLEAKLDPIRQAINVQYKKIDELLVNQITRRESLSLKAPFDGVVSSILRRVGEAVIAGEAVVTIAKPSPEMIVGWARENQIDLIKEGMDVKLIKQGRRQQIAKSEITTIAPSLELMPERLWQIAGVPEYGFSFLVGIPPGLKLTPEEKVGIKLL